MDAGGFQRQARSAGGRYWTQPRDRGGDSGGGWIRSRVGSWRNGCCLDGGEGGGILLWCCFDGCADAYYERLWGDKDDSQYAQKGCQDASDYSDDCKCLGGG